MTMIRYRNKKPYRGTRSYGNIVVDDDFGHGYMFNKRRSTTFVVDRDVLDKNFQKKKVKK